MDENMRTRVWITTMFVSALFLTVGFMMADCDHDESEAEPVVPTTSLEAGVPQTVVVDGMTKCANVACLESGRTGDTILAEGE